MLGARQRRTGEGESGRPGTWRATLQIPTRPLRICSTSSQLRSHRDDVTCLGRPSQTNTSSPQLAAAPGKRASIELQSAIRRAWLVTEKSLTRC
eukprot:1138597-Pelagomonas_calceolata.AAC.2